MIIRTWVEVGGMSDHLPVFLQIQNPEIKPMAPFKFNPAWLMEEDYRKLIGNLLRPLEENANFSYMKRIVENLHKVKRVTKPWARVFSANQEKQLKVVEISLKETYEWNNTGVFLDIELKGQRKRN